MGGSDDSDFGLSRSHRPHIELIINLNGLFHEQQLVIIVVNVVLRAQLYFLFLFFSKMEAPNLYNLLLVAVE